MILRWQTRTAWWIPVLICAIAVLGCEPNVYEPEGPKLPLSNQRIVDQLIGAPAGNSSIYMVYEDGSGGFYYLGVYEGDYCMGIIDRHGQTGWVLTFEDRPRDLYPLSGNDIGLTEAVIAIGGIDTDSDDRVDEARVLLVGSGGVMIDTLIIGRDDAAVWLNSVDAIGSLSFVAVGGSKIADIYYPFVATFEINPDSTLEMHNELILSDVSNQSLLGVQVDAGQVSGDDFLCYVSAKQYAIGDGAETVAIHAMTGSTTGTGMFDLTWTVNITQDDPLDIWTHIDCFSLHGGTLYLVGSADVEKENNPSSGYWDAGFVGSVSTSGILNWITMINKSTYSENYDGLFVTDDALYAVGYYSSYYKTDSEKHFGLAMLSIFDAQTGDEIYHLGFGNEEYESGFNTLFVDGTRAFCGGYTNYSTPGGGFQSWFAEIDIAGIGGNGGSELPVLSADVEGVESVDRVERAPGPYMPEQGRGCEDR